MKNRRHILPVLLAGSSRCAAAAAAVSALAAVTRPVKVNQVKKIISVQHNLQNLRN